MQGNGGNDQKANVAGAWVFPKLEKFIKPGPRKVREYGGRNRKFLLQSAVGRYRRQHAATATLGGIEIIGCWGAKLGDFSSPNRSAPFGLPLVARSMIVSWKRPPFLET